jgi:hypothetical protein
VDDSVSFRLYGNEFYFTWNNLSHHLGFGPRLPVSLERACMKQNKNLQNQKQNKNWQNLEKDQKYCLAFSYL